MGGGRKTVRQPVKWGWRFKADLARFVPVILRVSRFAKKVRVGALKADSGNIRLCDKWMLGKRIGA